MSPFSHSTISLFPVFHGRLEFAAVVRAALLEAAARGEAPDVVAVELPGTWKEQITSAVNRLPYLSLILDESGERHLFLPVEPTDALIEGLRTAKELGIPSELIDLDLDDYPLQRDPAPDPYPVYRLGYEPVMRAVLAEASFPRTPQDDLRETMMAHALQRLATDPAGNAKRVFCVLGVAHVQGVLARLESPQPRPLARAKPRQLKLYNWSEKSSREFMTEAPFLAAAYERTRRPLPRPLPGRFSKCGGEGSGPHPAPSALPLSANGEGLVPAVTLPLQGEGRNPAQPGGGVGSAAPSPFWGEGRGGGLDREAESERLLRDAVKPYAAEIGANLSEGKERAVTPRQFRLLGNFARKYARIENQIVPDFYQLVVAARGCVDDGYARQVWDLGCSYPWQDNLGLLPTIDLDEAFATAGGRRLTLRRTIRRMRPRLRGISDTHRAKEKYPGQWKTKWSGRVICSHVPEDLVIEDFGRYLQHRAKGMLSAERSRTEPFVASMKDGLDLRETLRNYHEGQLFVRENGKITGKVGSVVVIFDEDRPERPTEPALADASETRERFPWLVTWLGEHEQESDMALYATPAGEQVIGPGISRCEYGGFVMSYPPRRMLDVWSDRVFDVAKTKAERLLLAALDYSEERYVAYVAEKPPRPWLHNLATRLGRQIVYIPLGQIPRRTRNRINSFHVLEGQSVREYAKEYIPV